MTGHTSHCDMPATILNRHEQAHTWIMRWTTTENKPLPLVGKISRLDVKARRIADLRVNSLLRRCIIAQRRKPLGGLRITTTGIDYKVSHNGIRTSCHPTLSHLYANNPRVVGNREQSGHFSHSSQLYPSIRRQPTTKVPLQQITAEGYILSI